ncbi:MAG: hypothetical protein RL653_3171 [Pseudomonadota bacterium]
MSAPHLVAAAAVSPVLPGAGQWWLGQRRKAAFVLLGAGFTASTCGAWNALAAVDACWLARKERRGEPIGPYENAPVADFLSRL